jgi:hypothetical protein
MATLIYCDRCAAAGERVAAHFRVTFQRLADDSMADHPQDLCKVHYEQIWAGL